MAEYRIYRLDSAGRVSAGAWIEARDDTEALERARRTHERAEVWQGKRLVGRTGEAEA